LATALYVTREEEGGRGVDERAKRLTELKPHVSMVDAKAAMVEVDRIIAEAHSHIE